MRLGRVGQPTFLQRILDLCRRDQLPIAAVSVPPLRALCRDTAQRRQVAGPERRVELPQQRRPGAQLVEADTSADVLHLGAQRRRLVRVRRHELEAVVDRPRQQDGVAGPPRRGERLVEGDQRLGARAVKGDRAGPLDECPGLGRRVTGGPRVGERPVGPLDGRSVER